ncbi:dienelactone hydrolase family protein [soil metagenome]
MTTRQDTIDAGEGKHFGAYVSLPDAPNGRAVIVVQEIFGVTPPIREVADRYARAGYLAVAPDLFWRVEPGLSLSHSKEDMARAFEVLETFSETLAVQDLGKTIEHAKAQPGIDSVALIGMCLGGKLAYLAASKLPVGAAIAFYGVGIEKNLADAAGIDKPLQMYFGAKDKYVSPQAREQIAEAVNGKPDVALTVVPEADHGFYTRGDPAVIARIHAEVLAFLDKHLTSASKSSS